MNSYIVRAKGKGEAIHQISSLPGVAVELDYDASSDLGELIKLGGRHGVSIIFRAQEGILVESLQALQRGLAAEKHTWRQRFLYCAFPLSLAPVQTAKALYSRASEFGDVIVPADILPSIYKQWKN